jgi:hypothetical protein
MLLGRAKAFSESFKPVLPIQSFPDLCCCFETLNARRALFARNYVFMYLLTDKRRTGARSVLKELIRIGMW